eukprot:TRINITY_DN1385_c0_g1_i1.p1 TRINITY_DN1385_c0_g1~~TRINITY_DN1385_c0_g1_i1.p1  ORF type:complete len:370 (+),score=65.24 TRINITY_DN1385_c0_g1_i1:135-1244(+)
MQPRNLEYEITELTENLQAQQRTLDKLQTMLTECMPEASKAMASARQANERYSGARFSPRLREGHQSPQRGWGDRSDEPRSAGRSRSPRARHPHQWDPSPHGSPPRRRPNHDTAAQEALETGGSGRPLDEFWGTTQQHRGSLSPRGAAARAERMAVGDIFEHPRRPRRSPSAGRRSMPATPRARTPRSARGGSRTPRNNASRTPRGSAVSLRSGGASRQVSPQRLPRAPWNGRTFLNESPSNIYRTPRNSKSGASTPQASRSPHAGASMDALTHLPTSNWRGQWERALRGPRPAESPAARPRGGRPPPQSQAGERAAQDDLERENFLLRERCRQLESLAMGVQQQYQQAVPADHPSHTAPAFPSSRGRN